MMTYRLRYTPEFALDFEQIHADVLQASGNKSTADRYLRDFVLKIKKMQLFPESGEPVYFSDVFSGYYLVRFKAYNAFYVIKDDYIELIRALPSKSDYIKVLLGEYREDDIDSVHKVDYLNESTDEQRD